MLLIQLFEQLKAMCVSTPILAYPNYQLPFTLHTDSSNDGLGAVLYQKQDGKMRVIAYASRSVSKAEANYPAHKLEFLALKWAVCEKFHEYLYGSKPFEVFTDNNPLTYVLTSAKLDACGSRDGLPNLQITTFPSSTNVESAMLKLMHLVGLNGQKHYLKMLT